MLNKLIVPLSIIVAGGLIALAIVVSLGGDGGNVTISELDHDTSILENLISDAGATQDRLIGSPDAKIIMTEYSDLQCPACRGYHPVMTELMSTYGADGTLAWEYKHFPLVTIHPKATRMALGAECALELGGNEAYWEMIDGIFSLTDSTGNFNLNKMAAIAELSEIDRDAFNTCVDDKRHQATIDAHTEEALSLGATGTPYSVFHLQTPISENGRNALMEFDANVDPNREYFTISEDGKTITLGVAFRTAETHGQIIDMMLLE